MGGVDLWQNDDETRDNFDPQSMHDKMLEVVSISGTWHLGKLQVCRADLNLYMSYPSDMRTCSKIFLLRPFSNFELA